MCLTKLKSSVVFFILGILPEHEVIDYAGEKLGLLDHEQWMDQAAGAAEMKRER